MWYFLTVKIWLQQKSNVFLFNFQVKGAKLSTRLVLEELLLVVRSSDKKINWKKINIPNINTKYWNQEFII